VRIEEEHDEDDMMTMMGMKEFGSSKEWCGLRLHIA
jgi:hypothetical protein